MLQLFGSFWSRDTLNRIYAETNRYAKEELVYEKVNGEMETYTCKGLEWYDMTVKELKTFMAMKLYMGLNKLP
jgi:hypothetical protein